MNKKKIAIYLIAAQILTIIWVKACPKYIILGEGRTTSIEYKKDHNSYSTNSRGKRTYSKRWSPTSNFRHINTAYFWIGVWLIYMGCLSTYLLTDETKK